MLNLREIDIPEPARTRKTVRRYTTLELDGVDLVDRGANQNAHIMLFKRAGAPETHAGIDSHPKEQPMDITLSKAAEASSPEAYGRAFGLARRAFVGDLVASYEPIAKAQGQRPHEVIMADIERIARRIRDRDGVNIPESIFQATEQRPDLAAAYGEALVMNGMGRYQW